MRMLTMSLAVLSVTPAFAAERPLAQRISRAVAPVQISGSVERGRGLVTFGKRGDVISTMRQRPDGSQVTRERQTYIIDGVRHGAQVKTVMQPNGETTTTTHIFGEVRDIDYSQGKYKPLTAASARGKAVWASPVTKGAAIAGSFALPMLAEGLMPGASAARTVSSAIFAAGMGAAMAGLGYDYLRPGRTVVNVQSEKTITTTIPKKVTIALE